MNAFFKGMGSLNLFPPKKEYPAPWDAVGQAFQQTGDCIRNAIFDLNAQIQSGQVSNGRQYGTGR
jgi:hypothetical protein